MNIIARSVSLAAKLRPYWLMIMIASFGMVIGALAVMSELSNPPTNNETAKLTAFGVCAGVGFVLLSFIQYFSEQRNKPIPTWLAGVIPNARLYLDGAVLAVIAFMFACAAAALALVAVT